MSLIKKLTKHGNSFAIVIDKVLMELLNIDENTPVELVIPDGHNLVIRPVRSGSRQAEFQKVLKEVDAKYTRTMKKLAE